MSVNKAAEQSSWLVNQNWQIEINIAFLRDLFAPTLPKDRETIHLKSPISDTL